MDCTNPSGAGCYINARKCRCERKCLCQLIELYVFSRHGYTSLQNRWYCTCPVISVYFSPSSLRWTLTTEFKYRSSLRKMKKRTDLIGSTSVSDSFHFDTDPEIRLMEQRIRILLGIRPRIEKIPTFLFNLFSSDYPKILLCYFMNL